jgi:hypothetical protein
MHMHEAIEGANGDREMAIADFFCSIFYAHDDVKLIAKMLTWLGADWEIRHVVAHILYDRAIEAGAEPGEPDMTNVVPIGNA